ncbi:MAG TPA: hypothetical protein VF629_02340 [Hymenobacter sp.]|uniref:hypothetical protein n=1 Tax=Hymenobacter sp. TaxID=1898978 RepID=UPI002EDB9531
MKNLLSVAARGGRLAFVLLAGVLLSLGVATPGRAQDAPRWAGVEKVTDMSYRVWACNPTAKPSFIRLVDKKGLIYYEQFSSAVNFGRQLNVGELPNGEYALLVKVGKETHRFDLRVKSESRRWAEVTTSPAPADRSLATLQTVATPDPVH